MHTNVKLPSAVLLTLVMKSLQTVDILLQLVNVLCKCGSFSLFLQDKRKCCFILYHMYSKFKAT